MAVLRMILTNSHSHQHIRILVPSPGIIRIVVVLPYIRQEFGGVDHPNWKKWKDAVMRWVAAQDKQRVTVVDLSQYPAWTRPEEIARMYWPGGKVTCGADETGYMTPVGHAYVAQAIQQVGQNLSCCSEEFRAFGEEVGGFLLLVHCPHRYDEHFMQVVIRSGCSMLSRLAVCWG